MDLQRYIAIFGTLITLSIAVVRFTNIKCNSLDPAFASFSECKLKALQRNVIGLNITCNLHQLPVDNVMVNLDLYKKASGYRPFLYNISLDFCTFMKKRKSNPLFNILMNFTQEFTNINHSCSFNHDVLVKNAILSDDRFKYFPIPEGDYLFKVRVGVHNVWRMEMLIYAATTDQLLTLG